MVQKCNFLNLLSHYSTSNIHLCVFCHNTILLIHSTLKHIHLMGVRDVNDLSNVQTGSWEPSNAFKPQTASRNAYNGVVAEGRITQRGGCLFSWDNPEMEKKKSYLYFIWLC